MNKKGKSLRDLLNQYQSAVILLGNFIENTFFNYK